jgi:hypothetical protein
MIFDLDQFDPDVQLFNPTPERLNGALRDNVAHLINDAGLAYQRALRLWGANDPRTLLIADICNGVAELTSCVCAIVVRD